MQKQVCIIGAGSSGITAAKTLKDHGISFDCFEKGSNIGGNWRYDNDNGLSSAYRSLHINTNRDVMAYSDYPMPRHYPMFPHHSQIIQYFDDYVAHFGIRDKITFNTMVTEVARNEDGTYNVAVENGETNTYQYVIESNGHHWNPRYPEPPFAGKFTGDTLHAHHYRVPEQIMYKDVLIVGIGNSAVDIACEAAKLHSGRVTISSRSGAYIVPNWFLSTPFDNLASPITSKLPLALQRWLLQFSLFLARGRQEDYGVPKPNRPPLQEHPTVSQELLNLSGRGLIDFKPNIQAFNDKEVIFEDGTSATYDIVIYATGYKVTFPFLKDKAFDVGDTNDFGLYKKMIHPDYPNLFFQALIQPLGAIMPLAEVQAKWMAKIIKGECVLPSREAMNRSIEQDKALMAKRYRASPRHTFQVDFHPYKVSIEREMKESKLR
ncbi:MAG: NAD(P)-binding domain-containing protein [Spirosomataceae bacterium]